MKRILTNAEKQDIIQAVLSDYHTIQHLPIPMREKYNKELTQKLDKELSNIMIYPDGIFQLKNSILKKFKLVSPAKSVGIICGQSIGEMQTQTTLNSFHSTGIANRVVVQGVPRFLEIIDTNRSETQGAPTCTLFFKSPGPLNIDEARKRVTHTMVCYKFEQLFERHWIVDTSTPPDPWVAMHPVDITTYSDYQNRLCYSLNLDLLYRYSITLEHICNILSKAFPSYLILYSPLYEGRIDVWTDLDDLNIEEQLHPSILQTKICGIDRIQNIFFMKQNGEWYIETDGSNLEEIMNLEYVDTFRTFSNDIWEIYNLFGIEAVRSYIVEELTNLMPTIHSSHITLLTDRMTVTGRLKSISRYTRKHENSSVLSKATFEETLSGFLRSALMTEKDTINGSSASIICGKVPRVGTGMNDLLFTDVNDIFH
jgi:DNA-directed RNA polymerase subunit A"